MTATLAGSIDIFHLSVVFILFIIVDRRFSLLIDNGIAISLAHEFAGDRGYLGPKHGFLSPAQSFLVVGVFQWL